MSKANGSEALVAEQLSKDRAVIELCRRSLVNHFVVRDMDAALAYMPTMLNGWVRSAVKPPRTRRPWKTSCDPSTAYGSHWQTSVGAPVNAPTPGSSRHAIRCSSCRPAESAACRSSNMLPTYGPYAGRTSHRASARVERHRCEPALAFARSWPERHRIPVRTLRCPGIRRRQAQLPRHGRRRSRSASQRTVRYRIRRSTLRHQACARKVRGARRLASLEKELPAKDFLRLHRSCLVHRGHIASIEDHQALLDDGSSYPIAERRSREIKQSFELTL